MLKFSEMTGTHPQLTAKPEGVSCSTATPDPLLTAGSKGLCSSQYQEPISFSPNLSRKKGSGVYFLHFHYKPFPHDCILSLAFPRIE